MIPQQHIQAISDRLEDSLEILHHHGDLVRLRIHEFTANGLQGAALDPDRTSRPNQVDEHGDTYPDITDRTGEAATDPPDRNFAREFERHAASLIAFHAFLREIVPTKDDIDRMVKETNESDRADDDFEGTCEGDGRPVYRRSDMTKDSKRWAHSVKGHLLCSTCKRAWNRYPSDSMPAFIKSRQWLRTGNAA